MDQKSTYTKVMVSFKLSGRFQKLIYGLLDASVAIIRSSLGVHLCCKSQCLFALDAMAITKQLRKRIVTLHKLSSSLGAISKRYFGPKLNPKTTTKELETVIIQQMFIFI